MKLPTSLPAALLCAVLATPSCTTESHSERPGPKSVVVTMTVPTRAFEVRDDGRLAGSLLLYADPKHRGTGYYSVRNPQGQVLGMVDLDGRAWRYRIHEEQPEWLGTGTVVEGARRILGTSALARLEETQLPTPGEER
ncbi:MAG: hypothetical protein IPJ19_05110 [Planctomycetes bacterium]|nr:hypothetical protein [Planctomycetota bacterium]